MKVNDFVNKLKEVEKMPTLYKLGCFGNKKTKGYLLWDCSGLIKGVLWGYPSNGKYGSNGVPDINADTLITKCRNVSSNFADISVGEMVWLKGHCGVYVGNGKVIESSPKWENGVQVTKLNQRMWLKHGLLPYVDYSVKESSSSNDLNTSIKIIAKYVENGYFGNGHENRKEKIYDLVRKEVNK